MSDFWLAPSSTSILYVCEQQRFWRACAGRLCDKYHNLMSWLIQTYNKTYLLLSFMRAMAILILCINMSRISRTIARITTDIIPAQQTFKIIIVPENSKTY